MTRVKICGITNIEDALAAVSFGADALGFHVGEVKGSRNIISREEAAKIISQLPPGFETVLVTTSLDADAIVEAARVTHVAAVQFHTDMTVEGILAIKEKLPNVRAYKAVHVHDEYSIDEARKYEKVADAILLDTEAKEKGQVGGTGKTHDWEVSRKIVEAVSLPVILAGGLNPDNVAEAIKKVRPQMVDVNSGVSNSDRAKNLEKVRLFIKTAKSV